MEAEIEIKNLGVKAREVPLLAEIDAGCGLALRFPSEDGKKVEKFIDEKKLLIKDRYLIEYEEGKRKPKVKKYDLS